MISNEQSAKTRIIITKNLEYFIRFSDISYLIYESIISYLSTNVKEKVHKNKLISQLTDDYKLDSCETRILR